MKLKEVKEQLDDTDFSAEQWLVIMGWFLFNRKKFESLVNKIKTGMFPLSAFKRVENENHIFRH